MKGILKIESEDGTQEYEINQKGLTAIKTLLMERESSIMKKNMSNVKEAQGKDKILKRLNHLNWWKW